MNHGGARKGAGRKSGKKTVYVTFTINQATALLLSSIERGKRSSFIDAAIRKAIEAIN